MRKDLTQKSWYKKALQREYGSTKGERMYKKFKQIITNGYIDRMATIQNKK